jgi:hypothetical protein
VLLDAQARGDNPASATAGRLREPIQLMTGVLRAMGGATDGEELSWWWGEGLRQHVFRPPSVFNYYPPDYPVVGTPLVGPAFGIHNANTSLTRLNYLVYLLDWNGSDPKAEIPQALGTRIKHDMFYNDVGDAAKLVDRMANLALGAPLTGDARTKAIAAVSWWTSQTSPNEWQKQRVAVAAYIVFASPQYQVQR